MRSESFDPGALHPLVRDFYEQTAEFAMDVWSRTYVYVEAAGTLRCDHSVRFLGLPVLRLHYKMFRAQG